MQNDGEKKLYEKANDKLADLYSKADENARRIGYDRIENGIGTVKLVGFFAVLLAALLLIQSFLIITQCKVVFRYSHLAQGIVINNAPDSTDADKDTSGKTDCYRTTVRFEYDGMTFEGSSFELKRSKDLAQIGETVWVRFDPDDPLKIYLTKGEGRDSLRLVLLILGLVLNILCITLVVCKCISVFKPKSSNRLIAFTAARSPLALGSFIAAAAVLIAITIFL